MGRERCGRKALEKAGQAAEGPGRGQEQDEESGLEPFSVRSWLGSRGLGGGRHWGTRGKAGNKMQSREGAQPSPP